MENRTVYILGRILGKMVKAFDADSEAILTNAMHNPMQEITILHMNHIRDMPEWLRDYVGRMLNQIDGSENVSADIYPSQQSALTIGFTVGKVPFRIANEMSDRRISQQQLADKIGVNRVTVARWVADGFPKSRVYEIEWAIYSISGIIGNGYKYIEPEE